MTVIRRRPGVGFLLLALVPSACGGETASGCETLRDLHDEIADRFNEVAAIERDLAPGARAGSVADALDDIVELLEAAPAPEEPSAVFGNWEELRDSTVAEGHDQAAEYRAAWPEITQDRRAAAIPEAMLLVERWMSETEPPVPDDPAILERLRADDACRHVLQLRPPT